MTMLQGRLVFFSAAAISLAACAQGDQGFDSISTSPMTTTMVASSTTDDDPSGAETTSATTTTDGSATETDSPTDSDTGGDTAGLDDIDLNAPKVRIYQLSVRLFSNTNTTNAVDGDKAQNGVGKFADINDAALAELRAMGISHVWLHGVIQQATTTDNGAGEPADDVDAVKGKAGDYSAIRDYYDVCPDYAKTVSERMKEFEALVQRIHDHDMKVLIDLVPNHVARTYRTTAQGKVDFGLGDDKTVFFGAKNHLFYLVDPADQVLQLPAPDWWTPPGMPDGTIESENNDGAPVNDRPRATGNNVTAAAPAITDWYDTIKLNYGWDFTQPDQPGDGDPTHPTWKAMDAILAFWQTKGVDGFRVEGASMIPAEYWTWQIGQARSRDPDALFVADPGPDALAIAEVTPAALIDAGFDAVNDPGAYELIKRIFCCGGLANALTTHLEANEAIGDQLLRYSEHHLERRIASPVAMGLDPTVSGFGSANAGRPVSALLFLLSRGPLQIYNGQEVGEPAKGAEGYGKDDGMTSLYDYGSMPELTKWVNDLKYDGGGLSPNQAGLRAFYRELVELSTLPAIAKGDFLSLQEVNKDGDTYCSKGRWCYTFLRYSAEAKNPLLMAINLNPNNTYKAFVIVPQEALDTVGLGDATRVVLSDRLDPATELTVDVSKLTTTGVQIPLPPSQTRVMDLRPAD